MVEVCFTSLENIVWFVYIAGGKNTFECVYHTVKINI